MGASVLLVVIFSGVQTHPFDFTGEAPIITVWTSSGTSYVSGEFESRIFHTFVISQSLSAFYSHVRLPQYKLHAHWPDYATFREFGDITYMDFLADCLSVHCRDEKSEGFP